MKTPTVAEAIEFAKKSRSDCSNLVTFVALQETGMLAAYMAAAALTLTSCESSHPTINGHTPCATGTCWKEYPAPCQCTSSQESACFCSSNKHLDQ